MRIATLLIFCTFIWGAPPPEKPDLKAEKKNEKPSNKTETSDPNILETRPTKDFLTLNETDPIPQSLLTWDKDSAQIIYFSKTELPFVYLKGRLKSNYGISINDRFVPTKEGLFKAKLSLPLAISNFTIKLFSPDRNFDSYRLLGFWTKIPPSFRVKVQENSQISEQSVGFSANVKHAAFAQLYSDGTPTSLVDLDSQKHAKMTFRFYYPPEPEQLYDAWSLVIRNSRGKQIAEFKRFGAPPNFIDWREVASSVLYRDNYFYQLNLFKETEVFPGISNSFETIEGLSLLRSHYSLNFEIEPRAEIGYYTLDHTMPTDPNHYGGVFVSADVGLSLWNFLLLRGTALSALEKANPNENLNVTRAGMGFRLYTQGENAWLGSPHLLRLDVLATISAIGIAGNASIPRYIDWGVFIEPHIVLWAYNYFVPWVEYAIRPERGQKRLSYGASYVFFVRPWNMKLGLGIATDRILNYQPPGNPEPLLDRTFATLKTYATMTFFL